MKPTRQFEAAELMNAAKNYSVPFAKALLAGTPISLLAEPERQAPKLGITAEQKAMIEREINVLLRDLKNVEDTYGADILNLSLACHRLSRCPQHGSVATAFNGTVVWSGGFYRALIYTEQSAEHPSFRSE